MAILKPIVLNFPTRGATAVDYIDYFDEGHYGPDKPFFVNRFNTLEEVAAQMDECLKLQTTPGSMIHGGVDDSTKRLTIDGKWAEPLILQSPSEKYPQRAQYKIRFLLRFKFYGEFAYLDLGATWKAGDDTDPSKIIVILPDELTVVNRSMISLEDAEYIKDIIISLLTYDGTQVYSPDGTTTISSNTWKDKFIAQREEESRMMTATYVADDGFIFTDDNGLLTIE